MMIDAPCISVEFLFRPLLLRDVGTYVKSPVFKPWGGEKFILPVTDA